MKQTYVIDEEGGVTAYPSRKEAEEAVTSNGGYGFDSLETLESALAGAPATMATLIWNSLPGVEPVNGFKSKSVAAGRIWKYLQACESYNKTGLAQAERDAEAAGLVAKPKKPKKAKATRNPKAAKKARKSPKKAKKAKASKKQKRTKREKSANGDTKRAQIIEMISGKSGAALDAIMKSMGWQRHTCRGFLATLKTKHGLNIESFKGDDGERRYRLVA